MECTLPLGPISGRQYVRSHERYGFINFIFFARGITAPDQADDLLAHPYPFGAITTYHIPTPKT